MGPLEDRNNPLPSELNNAAIEPVVKQYDELRYRLMPYTYTLAWEARNTGMPFMRAMWLHYPTDTIASRMGKQYLWGRDLLIAPVYQPHATTRTVYLPEGDWYDWWTNTKETGAKMITRKVDLSIMPIYVRAGAIIPVDPIRQYTAQTVNDPTTLKVYRGADGQYTLYEDDGTSEDYLKGKTTLTRFTWDDDAGKFTIAPLSKGNIKKRVFNVQLLPEGTTRQITYNDRPVSIVF
ncbi:DUF5110 domain-containing protein [uncultured Chitinophaga sp.]|jgi:Alpha-glucosidases, family 31 of glycosyl hydrolases|uniref:glycoside hydrolase family 31 protein n=1 Tax=uncultured Chitinophaga sp. TaxID=339340 RepID=UPI00260BE03C|nr:DUF5110 domain-containing protein [uncultured Chitinophaga sp.]